MDTHCPRRIGSSELEFVRHLAPVCLASHMGGLRTESHPSHAMCVLSPLAKMYGHFERGGMNRALVVQSGDAPNPGRSWRVPIGHGAPGLLVGLSHRPRVRAHDTRGPGRRRSAPHRGFAGSLSVNSGDLRPVLGNAPRIGLYNGSERCSLADNISQRPRPVIQTPPAEWPAGCVKKGFAYLATRIRARRSEVAYF